MRPSGRAYMRISMLQNILGTIWTTYVRKRSGEEASLFRHTNYFKIFFKSVKQCINIWKYLLYLLSFNSSLIIFSYFINFYSPSPWKVDGMSSSQLINICKWINEKMKKISVCNKFPFWGGAAPDTHSLSIVTSLSLSQFQFYHSSKLVL